MNPDRNMSSKEEIKAAEEKAAAEKAAADAIRDAKAQEGTPLDPKFTHEEVAKGLVFTSETGVKSPGEIAQEEREAKIRERDNDLAGGDAPSEQQREEAAADMKEGLDADAASAEVASAAVASSIDKERNRPGMSEKARQYNGEALQKILDKGEEPVDMERFERVQDALAENDDIRVPLQMAQKAGASSEALSELIHQLELQRKALLNGEDQEATKARARFGELVSTSSDHRTALETAVTALRTADAEGQEKPSLMDEIEEIRNANAEKEGDPASAAVAERAKSKAHEADEASAEQARADQAKVDSLTPQQRRLANLSAKGAAEHREDVGSEAHKDAKREREKRRDENPADGEIPEGDHQEATAEAGEKPSKDIVLIGGYSMSEEDYAPRIKHLREQGYNVHFINPDSGIDASEKEKAYFVEQQAKGNPVEDLLVRKAAEVRKFMEDNGLVGAQVIGHSQGGAVGAYLSASNPELVQRLIAENPAGMVGEDDVVDLTKRNLNPFGDSSRKSDIARAKELGKEQELKDFQKRAFKSIVGKHRRLRVGDELPMLARTDISWALRDIKENSDVEIALLTAQSDKLFPEDRVSETLGLDIAKIDQLTADITEVEKSIKILEARGESDRAEELRVGELKRLFGERSAVAEQPVTELVDTWSMYIAEGASHTAPVLEHEATLDKILEQRVNPTRERENLLALREEGEIALYEGDEEPPEGSPPPEGSASFLEPVDENGDPELTLARAAMVLGAVLSGKRDAGGRAKGGRLVTAAAILLSPFLVGAWISWRAIIKPLLDGTAAQWIAKWASTNVPQWAGKAFESFNQKRSGRKVAGKK